MELSKFEDAESERGSMAWIKLTKNREKKTEEWLVSFRCGNYLFGLFDELYSPKLILQL